MQKSSIFLISTAVFVIGQASALAAASSVKAPPLPNGSAKAIVQAGESPAEKQRSVRAHKRPKKDKQRDDTLPTTAAESTTTAQAGSTAK